jgi:hypothetical protein
MTKEIDRYTYRVIWSEEEQEHVGLCSEFSSLSWLEETPEAALMGIRNLVRESAFDLHGNNEAVPEPESVEIPEWHKHELKKRIESYLDKPDDVSPWQDVKVRLLNS